MVKYLAKNTRLKFHQQSCGAELYVRKCDFRSEIFERGFCISDWNADSNESTGMCESELSPEQRYQIISSLEGQILKTFRP